MVCVDSSIKQVLICCWCVYCSNCRWTVCSAAPTGLVTSQASWQYRRWSATYWLKCMQCASRRRCLPVHSEWQPSTVCSISSSTLGIKSDLYHFHFKHTYALAFLVTDQYQLRETNKIREILLVHRADLRWGRGALAPPPDSLVASQIQKLADRSDVMLQNQNFPGLCPGTRWGSLQHSPRPTNWWGWARCPLPRTPALLSALQVLFLRVSRSNPLQSWQPY